MRPISPHLWFDSEALEAAGLYTDLFPDGRITHTGVLEDTPSGTVDVVTIGLAGQPFSLLAAGPLFPFNPAISFRVDFASAEEVDALWAGLAEGGEPLMDIGEYPFSPRYGWIQDRFGVSWQLMQVPDRPIAQVITPTLMFTGEVCGRAEEAMRFYASVFQGSSIDHVQYWGEGMAPNAPGSVMHGAFTLEGRQFAAMDSALDHGFGFNEAISLMVHCDTQAEIDHYWDALSADPAAEQCGWLKDRFGVSWQVVPTAMDAMMRSASPEQLARVTAAFLPMKKFDLAALQAAYDG
jgi:predicted 3-demethylubiquinone-9 3-methyltransferase (glyoxalase superfamily)